MIPFIEQPSKLSWVPAAGWDEHIYTQVTTLIVWDNILVGNQDFILSSASWTVLSVMNFESCYMVLFFGFLSTNLKRCPQRKVTGSIDKMSTGWWTKIILCYLTFLSSWWWGLQWPSIGHCEWESTKVHFRSSSQHRNKCRESGHHGYCCCCSSNSSRFSTGLGDYLLHSLSDISVKHALC